MMRKCMFGYVKTYNDELKLKEIKRYKKYYCALCNELRKSYGRITTMFLSYEMVFTLILLESFVTEEYLTEVTLSCQFDKIHIGTIKVSKSLLQYIAYINLFLTIWKFEDDWKDDKNILSLILIKFLKKNKRYIMYSQQYKTITERIDINMRKFYDCEKEGCDFDILSEIMGDLWSQIINGGVCDSNISKNNLHKLEDFCKDLGKWLYCIDAYDDLEKDIKKIDLIHLFKMDTI